MSSGRASPGFQHEALFYEGVDSLLAGTVPFIEAGLDAGENVLVALPWVNRSRLEAELGGAATHSRVRFADMEELGRNPARIIPAWRDFVEESCEQGRGMRGIGEPIWAQRSEPELEECARHESLLNVAFAAGPAWPLLCPYDVASLPEAVIERAHRTHPAVSSDGEARPSGDYEGLGEAAEVFGGELPAPPPDALRLGFELGELKAVRDLLAAWGEANGLAPPAIERLVLAINELVTNSIVHGGGTGTLVIWSEGDSLVCEVRDAGTFREPLVGRLRPRPQQLGGRGLWIANQLCDLVQIRSGAGGSAVRVTMTL